jgi:23S rRNA (pseudouridine1915-N3)-methyltransferase
MIKIICVGNLKESYLKEAAVDYIKRISKYSKIKIIEVEDKNFDREKSLLLEKEHIIRNIEKSDYVIVLDIGGETLNSIELANKINKLHIEGKSTITFIIGGSYGLSEEVKKMSNFRLSFSKFTFPHQLFRILLLEQLYRSFKVINNETYHK